MANTFIVGLFINHDKKEFSMTAREPGEKLDAMIDKELTRGHEFMLLARDLDECAAELVKRDMVNGYQHAGYTRSPRQYLAEWRKAPDTSKGYAVSP
ncbi:hypothetical protein [Ferrimonas pelagia]|uniref:Uncharacterized protein n=1 Tax=Ferrimonas pelagia TaxID=1177826 RepID=A0ABP9EGS5_9GAMM